jgi:O-antigen/teichoic acid export membrane protein
MSRYKTYSVKYNFAMNILLTMTNLAVPIITFPYFSRILLPEGMGKVAFALSFVSYFTMIAQLGIPTYGVRVCAQVRDNKLKLSKVVHELLIINFVMNLIAYLGLFILIFEVNKLYSDRFLFAVISLNIALNSMGLYWLYAALEQYSFITFRSLIAQMLAVVFMFLMVRSKDDYIYYAAASVIALSGSSLLNILNARKYITFKLLSNYNIGQHIKPIFTFFATSVAINVYVNLDAVMLGFLTDDTMVGLYNTGIKVNRILLQIVTSLGVVLLPRLSYYVKNNMMDEFTAIIKKAINFVILIAFPLVFYFIFFAQDTVIFIAGENFIGAVIPMQILMPIILIVGLSNITGIQILVPMGAESKLMVSVICGAIINFALNVYLIPIYGASGAAVSTLIAEFTVLIVQMVYIKKYIKEFLHSLKVQTLATVTFISYIILTVMDNIIVCLPFLKLVISFSCYMIIYILILLLLKEPLVYELLNIVRKLIVSKLKV